MPEAGVDLADASGDGEGRAVGQVGLERAPDPFDRLTSFALRLSRRHLLAWRPAARIDGPRCRLTASKLKYHARMPSPSSPGLCALRPSRSRRSPRSRRTVGALGRSAGPLDRQPTARGALWRRRGLCLLALLQQPEPPSGSITPVAALTSPACGGAAPPRSPRSQEWRLPQRVTCGARRS